MRRNGNRRLDQLPGSPPVLIPSPGMEVLESPDHLLDGDRHSLPVMAKNRRGFENGIHIGHA